MRNVRQNMDRVVKKSRCEAFTLVELLAVMAVISMLMGMIVGVGTFAKSLARRARGQAMIEHLNNALSSSKLDRGSFPPTLLDITNALPNDVFKDFDEDTGLPLDPWGRTFEYSVLSVDSYKLYSQGPKDSIDGDDIYSGK